MSYHLVTSRVGSALKSPHLLTAARSLSSSVNANDVDLAVVGGGIVGAASALEIKKRFPALQIVILEKEAKLGNDYQAPSQN